MIRCHVVAAAESLPVNQGQRASSFREDGATARVFESDEDDEEDPMLLWVKVSERDKWGQH